jgi:IS30 family transposase
MPGRRLTADERTRIEVLWSEGLEVPEIAKRLDRHPRREARAEAAPNKVAADSRG